MDAKITGRGEVTLITANGHQKKRTVSISIYGASHGEEVALITYLTKACYKTEIATCFKSMSDGAIKVFTFPESESMELMANIDRIAMELMASKPATKAKSRSI